jgi:sugar/nucleoside kinase (ribokinase family)
VYFAEPGFDHLADLARPRSLGASFGPIRTERIPPPYVLTDGDPTGCGDVWGATYFSRLLAGDTLTAAMRGANEAAARNVEHRGATGLSGHLRGQLSTR